MATPTRAELITILQNIANLAEEGRKFSEVNTGGGLNNFVTMADTLQQSLEGDNVSGVLGGLAGLRSSLASYLAGGSNLFGPHLLDWGRLLGLTETSTLSILAELFQNFVDETETVESRAFSYGTPAASGANVGSGVILRLTKDAFNFDIENATPEAKRADCVQDANSGSTAKSKERFLFRGATASPDGIESLGSGNRKTINAVHSDDSLLLDAGFDQRGGTDLLPTSISSWTPDVALTGLGDDFVFEDSTTGAGIFYPLENDDATRKSLRIKVSRTITQKINVRSTDLDQNGAYYCAVHYNGNGSAAGTLTLNLGNQSVAVVLASPGPGWSVLDLPLDTNSWFRNFNEEDLGVSVQWARTGGELSIDDIVFVQVVAFDGTGYVVRSSQTPFLFDDSFTWTDTATEAKIQRHLVRATGRYLPHSGAPSIADP